MTTQAQNEALALLGGWTRKWFSWETSCGVMMESSFWVSAEGEITREVPNFVGDLNLVHRVEKLLTLGQNDLYFQTLLRLYNRAFCAPSNLRSEAILRSTGLWVERLLPHSH